MNKAVVVGRGFNRDALREKASGASALKYVFDFVRARPRFACIDGMQGSKLQLRHKCDN
jgi:hypothetical protein